MQTVDRHDAGTSPALGVDPRAGLSAAEAARRLAADGPNTLRSTPPPTPWQRLLRQLRDPLVGLLMFAVLVSVAAWAAEGADGWPVDAIVVLAVLAANAVIGLVQEAKADDAVAALARMTAASSTVIRDGTPVSVPAAGLVRGDVLVLAAGDAVGADARLLEATGLTVQEAALTGESVPVLKTPGAVDPGAALGDRTDTVFKGTTVVAGVGRAVVVATGMGTEVGAIADLVDRAATEPSPLQREVARTSKGLGLAVIAIAVVVMAALVVTEGVHTRTDAVAVLLMGVSLAVAAVPEGLPAILSLVLALGVRGLARRNAVMKSLHAVETLGSASVICSDKTGTLTTNEMTLRTVLTSSGRLDLAGTGYRPEGGITVDAADPDAARGEAHLALLGGAVANNASLSHDGDAWTITGDPTEAALLVAAAKAGGVAEAAAGHLRTAEVPFDSERKLMSVLTRGPGGAHRLWTKGAADVLLPRCTRERVGAAEPDLDDDRRAAVLAQVEGLSDAGLRTLAVAYRDLPGPPEEEPGPGIERDLVLAGVVGILDPPREEARAAVARARRAGVRTIMITGDHPVTARRIAVDLGIAGPDDRVAAGAELAGLGPRQWRDLVREVSVYARVAPEHKLRIVDALQADGHVVGMTGDGVNDAPALKSADIGVAMGRSGTEVAKEASAMILADDDFATIVDAVHQGRVIYDNIRKFLRYLLSSNLGEVLAVFLGVVLAGWIGLRDSGSGELVVPLLATQILWINLVTDSAPALAMGVDPEVDDVMARPPRAAGEHLLDRAMWLRIASMGVVMAAVTLAAEDALLPGGLLDLTGTGPSGLDAARTAGFTTLVLAQLFNALNSRSARASAFRRLFANRWLWAAIVLAVVLQVAVVHLPVLQTAFGTVGLSPRQWLLCVALASAVLWVEELLKLLPRPQRADIGV